jgi:predicted nucleotidyltransferase
LSTVSITYFDSDAVRRATEAHVRALTARYPEIEEVILFGSVVKGTPVPGSDVDLLIVLGTSDRPFLDRIPAFLPTGFPVGMDVFPYTRDEFERMKRDVNSFVLGVIREGVSIFRRQGSATRG